MERPAAGARRVVAAYRERPGRLLLLAGLPAIALLAVIAGVLAWRDYKSRREQEVRTTEVLSRAAAEGAQRFLVDRINVLKSIAASPAVRGSDLAAVQSYFATVIAEQPELAGLAWIDRDGFVRAGATPPANPPTNLADRDYFRDAVATDAPAVGAANLSRPSNQPGFGIAVPIRSVTGVPIGVLAARITLEALAGALGEYRAPAAGELLVVDRADQLIVGEGSQAIPSVAGRPIVELARTHGTGVVTDSASPRGRDDRLIGFAPAPAGGWLLFVDQPQADAFGPARRTLALTLTLLSAVTLAMVAGAVWAGRRLDRAADERERLLADEQAARARIEAADVALRASEERLRLVVENIAEGVVTIAPDGRYLSVNAAGERILGVTREELLGRRNAAPPYRRLTLDGEPLGEAPTIAEVGAGGSRVFHDEYLIERPDGRRVTLERNITAVRDETGRFLGAVSTFADVTERKRSEEALAERARLAALGAEVGLAVTQGAGLRDTLQRCAEALVLYLDAAFARIWTLDEAAQVLELQASAGIYTHLDGPHGRVPVGALKIGLIVQERRPHVTNQVLGDPRIGDPEWAAREGMVAFAGYPLTVGDRPVGVMAVFARQPLSKASLEAMESVCNAIALGIERQRVDAERERLLVQERSARREAERAVRLRNQVLATVTHDLKNPLATIKGFSQMLQRQLARAGDEAPASLSRGLSQIDASASKMTAMMDELLDTARLQQGEPLALNPQPTDLEALVRDSVAAQQAQTDRHTLTLTESDGPIVGEWDPVRLERVVGNLLSNAIKYSPDGGTVAVALRRELDGGHAWAVLSVRDEGIGIPAADLPHVFDRWRRAGNVATIEGTGIGLAGAKQIVEQHGGTIQVESDEGRGTTVMTWLPLEGPAA